jgi:thiamine monophosphate synthase
LPALCEAVALARPLPLIAIGGVDLARLVEVQRSGIAGVAVISAVAAAEDAAAAVRALCAGWLEAEAVG